MTSGTAMHFRQNPRTIWHAGSLVLLMVSLLYSTCLTAAHTQHLHMFAQLAEGRPFLTEAEFDWNGDGVPDLFRLRAQREVGYIPEGSDKARSKSKSSWYHCWLVVQSGVDNSTLWEDEWTVKEADLISFREILDFTGAQRFFDNWFNWKFVDANNQKSFLNSFEVRRLAPEDISEDVLLAEMKRLKIEGPTPAQLKREMLNDGSLRIFIYRASRREDLRWAAYIPSLSKVMLFRYGFPD
jgi:hypothetical protein